MNSTKARRCPLCGANEKRATIFMEEKIDPRRLSALSFASRKEPEYMCHRMVRCGECEVVYAPFPPTQSELAHAYHTADYDSSQEAADAANAYVSNLVPLLDRLGDRGAALEIGTGTGVFLRALLDHGFEHVVGVEPSAAAIAAAAPDIRHCIIHGIFEESQFAPESFDLVCCFMTMEHVADPAAIAASALRLLRPGGAFVTVTHDYRAVVNRLMGRRSPIIDIEHVQLFSDRSIRRLFEASGYKNVACRAFANTYALRYWLRLLPLPSKVKRTLANAAKAINVDGVRVRLNVGNVIAFGFK